MKILIGDWQGFTAEDFQNVLIPSDLANENASRIANHILAEKLSKAPIVYAGEEVGGIWIWRRVDDQATHAARVVCIEKIEKKEEK